MTGLPCVAFLGPEGTYSHQAAHELFSDAARYAPKHTITDTFEALSSGAQFALLPWENSIHGIVIDAIDLLRHESVGNSIRICGEKTIGVQHCLLVRKGVKLAEVKTVLSHEQALGQCAGYLSKHLSHATRMKVPSTALAAERVSAGEGDDAWCAAIASSMTVALYPGLEVVGTGIQAVQDNFTRFVLLSTSDEVSLRGPPAEQSYPQAVVRFSFPQAAILSLVDILTVFRDGSGCSISRIDRRPSADGGPFDDVYFIVLRGPKPHAGSIPGFNPLSIYLDNVMVRLRIMLNQHASKPVVLGTW
ncbi:PDT-domain-containing protein [Calocera viscosa TUFC12733]|uniref:prephenate dehydratase n=1 Tax=Calocera viscosa (strain TUFC12733) TaxID=1330018 RepID=A0A167M3M5_CALVF|nr:PDT-domain-containing protein [Calocera viscosa TUFC12733]